MKFQTKMEDNNAKDKLKGSSSKVNMRNLSDHIGELNAGDATLELKPPG
jgi:hypothetical protein